MKIAIFSDVHANLPALETLIERTPWIDRYCCLGDTVGYGPWPKECAVLVRELSGHFVCQGNHERLHLCLESIAGQLPIVQAFYRHTLPWFTQSDWITDLPTSFMIGDWVAQHKEEAMTAFAPSTLVGHSHRANTYLTADSRIVVHVGSVGQSRRAIDRAEWAEMDTDTSKIIFRSEPYDFDRLLAEMRSRQYPDECIDYYIRKPRTADL